MDVTRISIWGDTTIHSLPNLASAAESVEIPGSYGNTNLKLAPQLGIARIATEQANSLRRTLVTSTAAILAGALSGPAVFAPSTARASDGTSLHTCVFGEFEVLSGQEAHALQLMLTMTAAVRREPGCVLFLPYRFSANTDRYHIHEIYKDFAAFEAHLSADHTVTFNNVLKTTVIGGASTVTHLVEVSP